MDCSTHSFRSRVNCALGVGAGRVGLGAIFGTSGRFGVADIFVRRGRGHFSAKRKLLPFLPFCWACRDVHSFAFPFTPASLKFCPRRTPVALVVGCCPKSRVARRSWTLLGLGRLVRVRLTVVTARRSLAQPTDWQTGRSKVGAKHP